jgi:hypothetical protein
MSFVKNAAVFVGGVVFGSLGFKLLGSKEAKNAAPPTAHTAIGAETKQDSQVAPFGAAWDFFITRMTSHKVSSYLVNIF